MYCFRGLKIARVAAVFAHMWNHLRKLGAAGDLGIAQNGRVIGAVNDPLLDVWTDLSEEHPPADSISQSFGAHIPVQPTSEIPCILVKLRHRGIRRSRSHSWRISRAAREVVLLQQRAAVIQRRNNIHRSECPAIDPQRSAWKRTIWVLLRAKRLHARAKRPVVERRVHHGYQDRFEMNSLGRLKRF